jgi:hypothetical protein
LLKSIILEKKTNVQQRMVTIAKKLTKNTLAPMITSHLILWITVAAVIDDPGD